jgi:hypothetical protein
MNVEQGISNDEVGRRKSFSFDIGYKIVSRFYTARLRRLRALRSKTLHEICGEDFIIRYSAVRFSTSPQIA